MFPPFNYNSAVVSKGCIASHFFFVNERNETFACGRNEYGQLGLGHKGKNELKPVHLQALNDKKVMQIACGESHSVFLMSGGSVLTCGRFERGQLGRGLTNEGDSYTPKAVEKFDSHVIQVECGAEFTACVSSDGNLYMFGANDHGQLGCGDTTDRRFPTRVEIDKSYAFVGQVACGRSHSVFLLETGILYGHGANVVRNGNDELRPVEIRDDISFDKVNCGESHAVCISQEGPLFTFGSNDSGQLGFGNRNDVLSPTELEYFSNANISIRSVSSGLKHTICQTKDGDYYGFGANESFQLLLSNQRMRLEPEKLRPFDGEKIHSVVCFGNNTCFVTESRRVLGVGSGGFCEADGETLVPIPIREPYVIAEMVKIFGDVKEDMDVMYSEMRQWSRLHSLRKQKIFASIEDARKHKRESNGDTTEGGGQQQSGAESSSDGQEIKSVEKSTILEPNDGPIRSQRESVRNYLLEQRISVILERGELLENSLRAKENEIDRMERETNSLSKDSLGLMASEHGQRYGQLERLRKELVTLGEQNRALQEKYNKAILENLVTVGELEKLRSNLEDLMVHILAKVDTNFLSMKRVVVIPLSAEVRRFRVMQLELAKLLFSDLDVYAKFVSAVAPDQNQFVPGNGEKPSRTQHVYPFFRWLSGTENQIVFTKDNVSIAKEALRSISFQKGIDIIEKYERERENGKEEGIEAVLP